MQYKAIAYPIFTLGFTTEKLIQFENFLNEQAEDGWVLFSRNDDGLCIFQKESCCPRIQGDQA